MRKLTLLRIPRTFRALSNGQGRLFVLRQPHYLCFPCGQNTALFCNRRIAVQGSRIVQGGVRHKLIHGWRGNSRASSCTPCAVRVSVREIPAVHPGCIYLLVRHAAAANSRLRACLCASTRIDKLTVLCRQSVAEGCSGDRLAAVCERATGLKWSIVRGVWGLPEAQYFRRIMNSLGWYLALSFFSRSMVLWSSFSLLKRRIKHRSGCRVSTDHQERQVSIPSSVRTGHLQDHFAANPGSIERSALLQYSIPRSLLNRATAIVLSGWFLPDFASRLLISLF